MCAVRDDKGVSRKDLRWLGLGIEFCTVVCIFAYAGYWIDRLLESEEPKFIIAGFFAGFILMFYYTYKSTKELRK